MSKSEKDKQLLNNAVRNLKEQGELFNLLYEPSNQRFYKVEGETQIKYITKNQMYLTLIKNLTQHKQVV